MQSIFLSRTSPSISVSRVFSDKGHSDFAVCGVLIEIVGELWGLPAFWRTSSHLDRCGLS